MNKMHVLDLSVRQKIVQRLEAWLADSYILYLKTQNFHWNVIDPKFYSLHKMFEDQYEELVKGIDEIAERIRMLGLKSKGSMKEFLEIATLEEAEGDFAANEMIIKLLNDHQTIANYLRAEIEEMTTLGDHGTADLMIQRLRFHEKTAWMLQSSII